MARVKGGTVSRNRRKRVLKLAKGYFGSKHILYKTAHEQVMHSFKYAYNDRRKLKSNMRKLWIARINAAARMNDLSYSRLMHGLKLANIEVNRKMLSEMAIHDAAGLRRCAMQQRKHWLLNYEMESPLARTFFLLCVAGDDSVGGRCRENGC